MTSPRSRARQGRRSGSLLLAAVSFAIAGQARAYIHLDIYTNGQHQDLGPGSSIVAGTPVTWSYVLLNDSDTTLTDVAVADDQGATVSCPSTSLPSGAYMTCTASGLAFPGAFQNGGVATATYTNPADGADVRTVHDEDLGFYQGLASSSEIGLYHAVNGFDANSAPGPSFPVGTPLSWSYVVSNLAASTISGILVTDSLSLAVSCPGTSLAPGEWMACTAASNALSGPRLSIGTTSGTLLGNPVVTQDAANYLGINPGAPLLLQKLLNGSPSAASPGPDFLVGTPVSFSYLVTNGSTAVLSGLTVVDSLPGLSVSCPKTTLAPGEMMTCSASSSARLGAQSALGTATGNPPAGSPVQAIDVTYYTGILDEAALSITTFVNGSDANTPPGARVLVGDPIRITYLVRNGSGVEATGISVTDQGGWPVSCPSTVLQPGEQMTCSAVGAALPGTREHRGSVAWSSPSSRTSSSTDPGFYTGEVAMEVDMLSLCGKALLAVLFAAAAGLLLGRGVF